MFVECLEDLPGQLNIFTPDWNPQNHNENHCKKSAMPHTFHALLQQRADDYDQPWPLLTASDWLDFTRTGNRERFEASYMKRRRMLNAFAMAEYAKADSKHMDRIIDGIMLLCEESGWQLPAHNTYIRDTPCHPLPDNSRPVIDLFAAETGAQLATLKYLFGKKINKISPLINDRIKKELSWRIIKPYLEEHFWWMGNGDEPMCNWTAWCTQNILLTVFLSPCDEATKQAVVRKAAVSLDAFLKDYGEDGACEEGILYYRHAGLCLFGALDILAQVAPQAFAPLWQNPKIRNIAEFVAHMHVQNDRYFNFADSSARAGYCGAREYLFGKAVGSDMLQDFALNSWQQDPAPDLPDEVNLHYRLLAAHWRFLTQEIDNPAPIIEDHYYPSIGLMTARDDHYALAVKAGNNGDSHNHNDVGSFILYKNNKPFLIDIGVETYSAKTFSKDRYDIWTMQSIYHNLPHFNGIGQMDGEAYAARDVKVQLDDDICSMEMDLADTYPQIAGLKSYRRTMRLIKGHGVEMIDEFEGTRPPTLSLMLAEKPDILNKQIIIAKVGKIEISGGGIPKFETIDITDPRLLAAWPDSLYRILVPMAGTRLRLFINGEETP